MVRTQSYGEAIAISDLKPMMMPYSISFLHHHSVRGTDALYFNGIIPNMPRLPKCIAYLPPNSEFPNLD